MHCPQSWPLLSIIGATQGAHHLRYIDCATGKRGKPHGSTGLELFMTTTAGQIGKLKDARFVGKFTDNPIELEHDQAIGGMVATYYARWVSERGETGPFCVPVKMRIVA